MTQVTNPIVCESNCNIVLATCIERAKDILDSLYTIERDTDVIEGAYMNLESYTKDIRVILDGSFSKIYTLIGKTIGYKVLMPGEKDSSYKTMVCADIGVTDDGLLYCFDKDDNRMPGYMHLNKLYSLLRTGYLYYAVDGKVIDFIVLY